MKAVTPLGGFKMAMSQDVAYNVWVRKMGIFQVRLVVPKPAYERLPSSVWFGWDVGNGLNEKRVPGKFRTAELAADEAYQYVRTLAACR